MNAPFPLLLQSFSALAAVMALAGCGFALAAGVAVKRYRSPAPELASPLSVTLLKPLYGEEPGLGMNLAAFLDQDYGGEVELRLGVQRATDPVLPAMRTLAADVPNVRLVLDGVVHGTNAKVSNLINIERAAPLGELVVQSDSDIGVPPDYLTRLAAALAEPGVGVASCLYHGETTPRPSSAARLSAMGVSYQILPMFAVGVALGATPCMGSTIALRRDTLERIGGFASVKDVLADDYELGAKVRALGLRSVVPPFLVSHMATESTLREVWAHELRWSRTVAHIDRWGHLGSIVTYPAPLALLSAALDPSAWWGWSALVASLCARLWLKGRVDAVVGASSGPWWLLPVRDMLSLAVFVAAWFAARVDWRGSRFHVGRDGGLTPV